MNHCDLAAVQLGAALEVDRASRHQGEARLLADGLWDTLSWMNDDDRALAARSRVGEAQIRGLNAAPRPDRAQRDLGVEQRTHARLRPTKPQRDSAPWTCCFTTAPATAVRAHCVSCRMTRLFVLSFYHHEAA